MKNIIAILTALVMSVVPTLPEKPEYSTITIDGDSYHLTFNDEFDGTELDRTKWDYCPEWKRQDYNAYWDDDMTSLDGKGNLELKIDYKNGAYYSGAIQTEGIFEQQYGYFEVRCKLNTVPGYWSAFWLMGDTVVNENNSGEDGTEIDIYESPYYTESAVNHGLNWDGYGLAHKSEGFKYTHADLYKGYHTFALKWTPECYYFYVDGVETRRTSAGGVCKAPLYLIMSLETGSWAGNPPPAAVLPDSVYVDYIRVYQAD